MTPQERAAAFVQAWMKQPTYTTESFINDVLEHDKQTRRATLDDVGKALNEMHWKDHWYANQLRKKLDRLREGV